MGSDTRKLRQFGNFQLDAEKKVLWHEGEPVALPLKEIELLCVLTEGAGEVVTRDEILDRVWADAFVEESNLSRHVYMLRKTFRDCGESQDLIQTVPRRGYRFTGKIQEIAKGDLIIEKHTVTRTLIEAHEETRYQERLLASAKRLGAIRYALPALAAVVLLVGGAVWWSTRKTNSPAGNRLSFKSIAILPLRPASDDADNRALSLGFADALITSLGTIPDLKIISANAVSRYADLQKEPEEIGKDLSVDGVFDGTLQRANGKLRVTLRLIRSSDGAQVWSSTFDESEAEIFRLQDRIASQTAQALALHLKPQNDSRRPTDNLEAYNLFLKGDYLFRRRLEIANAISFFRQAIALDPNFARAWAGLAASLALGTEIEEAELALNKALEIDPNLAEAHATRGFIKMFHYWDWGEAEASLNRALKIDPNSTQARHWRGVYLSLYGRFDEAKAEMKRALELDPVNLNFVSDLGQVHYFARDYTQAEEFCKKALSIDPEYAWAHSYLSRIYQKQGKDEAALEHFLRGALASYTDKDRVKAAEMYRERFVRGGWPEIYKMNLEVGLRKAAALRKTGQGLSLLYHSLAVDNLHLGRKSEAIEYLHLSLRAKTKFEQMNFTFPYLKVEPMYDDLRTDRRFHEFLQQIRLG